MCATNRRCGNDHDAAIYNTQLGIAYMRRGDLAIAQTKLDRALQEAPDDPDVHSARAMLFARLQQPEQADREFREALSLAPKNPDFQNNYAVYLCSVGRNDEGVQTFLRAAHNPEYLTPELAYVNAGICLRASHHDVEAFQMFVDALTYGPTSLRPCGSSPTSISPKASSPMRARKSTRSWPPTRKRRTCCCWQSR